ncbi:MAG: hypothetical protein DRQ99_24910 [Candidatus Parabeggiatoa sp. nov. 3]|nr:MAG: hypothetical protein DRQ99_24910 [Gammaproteobacteria bacterium]
MQYQSLLLLILIPLCLPIKALATQTYPWLTTRHDTNHSLVNRIATPPGFERTSVPKNSFGHWLRHLPLKSGVPPVYLYNGKEKRNQSAHHAIIDIDVGHRDLQQCADAIIRLRAEYLYSKGHYDAIHFNFTSGDEAAYKKWQQGYRPQVRGNQVKWRKKYRYNNAYRIFRLYTNTVFIYAGSYSLSQELKTVKKIQDMKIGDIFIKGGFPGHAIIVLDMAINTTTGKTLFLLAQSYMPAQDIHILINPLNDKLSPWYELDFGETLQTPEWTFDRKQLKRFP